MIDIKILKKVHEELGHEFSKHWKDLQGTLMYNQLCTAINAITVMEKLADNYEKTGKLDKKS